MNAVAKQSRGTKPGQAARVLVVDDHPVVRQGLRLLIDHEPDLAVCAEAETAADALEAIAEHKPDVALVDLSLKGVSGLELIKDIRVRHADLPVLVLSMSDEGVYAERALRAGARGYLMKEAATDEVLTARQTAGRPWIGSATVNSRCSASSDADSARARSPGGCT